MVKRQVQLHADCLAGSPEEEVSFRQEHGHAHAANYSHNAFNKLHIEKCALCVLCNRTIC